MTEPRTPEEPENAPPEGFWETWTEEERAAFIEADAEARREYHAERERSRPPPNGESARFRVEDPAPPEWPDPKPIESRLAPVKAFNSDLLPPELGGYVFDVAERQQAPPDFAAVAAMCGIAAIAGNDVKIKPKGRDDWEVTPNLWGANIGRPSMMKSPSMRSALAPVYAAQDFARADWEMAKKDRQIDAALGDIGAKDAAKKAAKAMRDGDMQSARRLIAEHMEADDEDPPCPRFIVNDATVEKLGELLNENKHGLLVCRDELSGFLSKLDSADYVQDRAFYLEAYNGDGPFTYDRIGRGTTHIERVTVSIIGGISAFTDFLHRSRHDERGDGRRPPAAVPTRGLAGRSSRLALDGPPP